MFNERPLGQFKKTKQKTFHSVPIAPTDTRLAMVTLID